MNYLKYKTLYLGAILVYTNLLIGNAKINELALLNSSLSSLASYSNILQPIKPIIPSVRKKPIIPLHPGTQPAKVIGSLTRKDFFKDVVGMNEDQFRQTYGWEQSKPHDWGRLSSPPAQLNKWIKQYDRRAAIFQGRFGIYTPEQLKQEIIKTSFPLTQEPYFRIIIHNPNNPQQTDIRALQADHQWKYANFQVASTFWGPLEGGMIRWTSSLEKMLKLAVQGEEASISAAPATIFRKYFMTPRFLLEKLKHKFHIKQGKFAPHIEGSNYHFEQNDIDKVGIGIHQNIVVTSGYGKALSGRRPGLPGPNDTQERLEVKVKDWKVDTSNTQIIHQIFTSAYDLGNAYKKYGKALPPKITNAARMVLNGMYKGCLAAVFVTKSPVLFLTLLGGGSFRNDLNWIYEAIEQYADFIKRWGIQITLIYRPDPGKETRNTKIDRKFLRNMFTMADKINDSNLAKDTTFNNALNQYLNAAYSNDQGTQAHEAHALNAMINNALPSYAPKIDLGPKLIPATPPVSDDPSILGPLEAIMTLKNGSKLVWRPAGNDAVLMNVNPKTSEYIYVAPGYPGQSLPNGLYYWKSQGLSKQDIGSRKTTFFVKNYPQGKDFVYTRSKNTYVDSHQSNKIWDPSQHTKNPQWKG